ncbi:MAG TPA: PAS domain-containing sensor histidine kinase, partial [Leptospiraceae bacterium]|nr:PAS domain-containing sensor histidine kinase [Leptospiraceae bacterium]
MDSQTYQQFLLKGGIKEEEIPSIFKQGRFMVFLEGVAGFLIYLIVKENPSQFGHSESIDFLEFLLPSLEGSLLVINWATLHFALLFIRFLLFFILGNKNRFVTNLQKISTFLAGFYWGISFLLGANGFDKTNLILLSLIILFVISGWCVTTVSFRYTLLFAIPAFLPVILTLFLYPSYTSRIYYPEVYLLFFISVIFAAYKIGKNHDVLYRLAVNITREKEETEIAQKALFESECEYRNLVQNTNGIIIRWDSSGKILFMNAYALSFFGYEENEIIGKNILDTILPEKDSAGRDMQDMINSFLKNPESFADNENENKLKDGSIVTIRWRNSISFNKTILSVGVDITENVIAREELKKREQELSSILEAIPMPVVITHSTGNHYLYVNEKAINMFKVPREKVSQVRVPNFVVDPPSRDAYIQKLRQNPEKVVTAELLLRDFEGREFWTIISYAMFNFRGEMAILAGIQDITEQKRVEEILSSARKQAEESNQLKDRFISLVSHDLRGPIGGIQTMSEMLISPEYKDTIQKEGSIKFLTMINKTSTGLIELLNQLLNITRLKTGRIIPIKKHLDAKTLVENIHMTLNVKMEEMGIHFENEIESGKSIYADPHLLGEVVSNLLTNAIKFTPKGGTIFVGMEKEDEDYTYLWIKDSGTGIPPAILPDIFKHEVKTTLVGLHGEKGTGLGLPYCKDIIDAHGGSIDVSSDKNKGTCFKIILPKIR